LYQADDSEQVHFVRRAFDKLKTVQAYEFVPQMLLNVNMDEERDE